MNITAQWLIRTLHTDTVSFKQMVLLVSHCMR